MLLIKVNFEYFPNVAGIIKKYPANKDAFGHNSSEPGFTRAQF